MDPAGIAAASASEAATPMSEATRVTITACSTTPPKSVRDPAPRALSTP